MNSFFLSIVFSLGLLTSITNASAESFYQFKYTDTNKKEISFNEFKGKTVLVVNIATRCGFTGQLDDLEKLYQQYKDKNFVVIGFPSNDFFSQAPESSEEIGNFCRLKYGATFPIFEKQTVKGDNMTALYKWLTTQKGFDGSIGWNFTKFLVNKNGAVVGRFSSNTGPLEKEVTSLIDKNL